MKIKKKLFADNHNVVVFFCVFISVKVCAYLVAIMDTDLAYF